MLRPDIFLGFRGRVLELRRAHEKLIFRRDENMEGLAVAHHVKYVRADDGHLPDHANVGRFLREDKSSHAIVLLDYACIGCACGQLHRHAGVDGGHCIRLLVISSHKVLFGCGLKGYGRPRGSYVRLCADRTAGSQKRHCCETDYPFGPAHS